MERVKNRLRYKNGVFVDAIRRAGGLALLWNEEAQVSLRCKGMHCIDAMLDMEDGKSWRFTGIYGWPEGANKHRTWELMRDLGRQSDEPWVIAGDFNEVLYEFEKRGGNPCDYNIIQGFRGVVDELGLRDVNHEGLMYTWSNRRSDNEFIEKRLDRALASEGWFEMYPYAKLRNEVWDGSDHLPIILEMAGTRCEGRKGPRRYYFEAKWLHEEGFEKVVDDVWQQTGEESSMIDFGTRIKECGKRLKDWDRQVIGNVPRRVAWLQKRLTRLRNMRQTAVVLEETREVEGELRRLRRHQETAAWQRCRPFYLRDGDRNTAFFHAKTAQRRKRNVIHKLKDSSGNLQTDKGLIHNIVLDYFGDLFTSS